MTYVKFTSIKFQKSYSIRKGTELLNAYKMDLSLPLRFGCCQGNCGTCAFKVVEGNQNLSPPTKEESATLQKKGLHCHRLACQCALLGDVTVE